MRNKRHFKVKILMIFTLIMQRKKHSKIGRHIRHLQKRKNSRLERSFIIMIKSSMPKTRVISKLYLQSHGLIANRISHILIRQQDQKMLEMIVIRINLRMKHSLDKPTLNMKMRMELLISSRGLIQKSLLLGKKIAKQTLSRI